MGIIIANAPMFLTNAERMATAATSSRSCRRGPDKLGAKRRSAISMTPERDTAPLTTSALPTMMTMSSAKPVNAFSKGTTPSVTAARSATAAMMS
jgi:hypothetical protein